jgi:hypothetical protein
METRPILIALLWVSGIAVFFLMIGAMMWAWPQYASYKQEMAGQDLLKMASWNQKIALEDARSKVESSKLIAQAEIERAKGAAEATRILGEALRTNDAYLKYLWVQAMQAGTNQVIYVPTEAQVPIVDVRVPAPAAP